MENSSCIRSKVIMHNILKTGGGDQDPLCLKRFLRARLRFNKVKNLSVRSDAIAPEMFPFTSSWGDQPMFLDIDEAEPGLEVPLVNAEAFDSAPDTLIEPDTLVEPDSPSKPAEGNVGPIMGPDVVSEGKVERPQLRRLNAFLEETAQTEF